MHAVLITFHTGASLEDLATPFADYARALCEQPGFISKVWINDGTTLGGFHLFVDADAADAYLGSEQAQGLMATEGFDGFEVTHFDVLEDLSAMTGINREVAA